MHAARLLPPSEFTNAVPAANDALFRERFERALEDVDTRAVFLGKPLRAPLIISSMTGGTARARAINEHLAVAAEAAGVGLALGSHRAALENPALVGTYDVRRVAPGVVLFANLGAVQLNYGLTVDDARRAVFAAIPDPTPLTTTGTGSRAHS